MKMTNTSKLLVVVMVPIALVLGLWLGRNMPAVSFLLGAAVAGFVAWILLSNKQGAQVDAAARAQALAVTPAAGKVRIYVTRRGFAGGAQGMNIRLDSGHEGQIRAKYFMMAELDPGSHTISARMAKQGEKTRRDHQVTLDAGDSILLEITLEMGVLAMTPLFAEERQGRRIVATLEPLRMVDWLRKPA